MLKVVTALRRPADRDPTGFLSEIEAASQALAGQRGVHGVVVSEVIGRLRGDLQADVFVEEWRIEAPAPGARASGAPGTTEWLTREHVLKRPTWTDDPAARKVIGTAYRRDDFTTEAFFRYWREIHAPISARAAGLGGYVVSEVLQRLNGTMEADAFVEQWWPDQATLDAAGTSEEVVIAWQDVPNYAKTTGTFWSVREHVVAEPPYDAPGFLEA